MAYLSENSCKKGCSCDSCKSSHKNTQSEGFRQKAAELVNRTRDALRHGAEVVIKNQLHTPDNFTTPAAMITPFVVGGAAAVDEFTNNAISHTAKKAANKVISTVKKAVAENSNYPGSTEQYKDYVDRYKKDLANFQKERDPYARQHLQMIAKKSLENVQNHPLHSKQPIKEDLNAPIRKPSDYVTHVFSFREGEEHGVHVGTWHGDKFTANDSNHPIYGTGKSYQKHNTLAPPGDFKRLPHENAANEVHVVAKPTKELDMNNDDSRKHWHEHHQSMSAMFDSLAKRTGTAKEKYEWRKKAAHHQDEAMKVRPEFYTNPITGKSEEPHHVKDFEKWTPKPKETSDEKKAEDMLRESHFKPGQYLQHDSKKPMQGVEPGVPHEVVDVERKSVGPFGDLVTYHLKHPTTGKVHKVVNAHTLFRKVEPNPIRDQAIAKASKMSEELKTVDDVTKTLPIGVEKKGPGEAYGDVEKCAPAQKDKDKTVVAGKTGEEYSKKPQEEVKQMKEDKYARLAEAAFGPLNRSNPFRSASLNEEQETKVDGNHPVIKGLVNRINNRFSKGKGKTYYDGKTNGVHVIVHKTPEDPDTGEHHELHFAADVNKRVARHIGGWHETGDEFDTSETMDPNTKYDTPLDKPTKELVSKAAQQGAMEEGLGSNIVDAIGKEHDKTFERRPDLLNPKGFGGVVRAAPHVLKDVVVGTVKGVRNTFREEEMEDENILNEVGDTEKGREMLKKVAARAVEKTAKKAVKAPGYPYDKNALRAQAIKKGQETVRRATDRLADRGYKQKEESINQRFPDVERDIAAIMGESYKKKKMMEDATNIQIATPEQRNDWLDVGRGSMDITDYINKYKV